VGASCKRNRMRAIVGLNNHSLTGGDSSALDVDAILQRNEMAIEDDAERHARIENEHAAGTIDLTVYQDEAVLEMERECHGLFFARRRLGRAGVAAIAEGHARETLQQKRLGDARSFGPQLRQGTDHPHAPLRKWNIGSQAGDCLRRSWLSGTLLGHMLLLSGLIGSSLRACRLNFLFASC
jgi:hypothetical protein